MDQIQEKYKKEAEEKFPDLKVLDIFYNIEKSGDRDKKIRYIKFACPKHGEQQKRYYDYIRSCGCKKCSVEEVHLKQMKVMNTEQFLEKAKEIHGDKYDYSKVEFEHINKKICIICKKHGEFLQAPASHLDGHGCPKCGLEIFHSSKKITKEDVIKNCKEVHGDKYDYSKVEWIDSEHDILIVCPEHGEFYTRYHDFLKGHGCPKCGTKKAAERQRETKSKTKELRVQQRILDATPKFIEAAKKIHPDFDYSKVRYINNHTKIIVGINGKDYEVIPASFLEGALPREISNIERGLKKAQNRWKNIEQELGEIHDFKYLYNKDEIDLIKSGKAPKGFTIHIKCPKHGIFEQTFFDHRCGSGCKKCAVENRPVVNVSKAETEILDFLKSIGVNGEKNRSLLNGKELDIYIPERNIAIEYDGLFWHNNINNYYKFEECRKQGIRLIQITEPEWITQKEKIKNYLKSVFGIFDKKVYARKCKIKEISNKEYKKFLQENHLQNYGIAPIRYGLFYNKELVQVAGFGKSRYRKDVEYELVRECSKIGYNIVGGKSKLLKHFEEAYHPRSLISYCEKNKFSGNSYFKCGFELMYESQPSYDYFYKKEYKKYSRFTFQKHKLSKLLEVFDPEKTEWENMQQNGWMRLFDYGNYVFMKKY